MDGSNASRRSYRRTVAVIAVAGTMLVTTAADAAVGVLTKRRAQEVTPGGDRVGGKLFIGWSQAPRSHPNRHKALVKRGSRKPIRLNRPGTRGYMGGIDGQVAVYQEITPGDSDIRRYNLKTGDRAGVAFNGSRWDFGPSISGRFILFGRNSLFDSVILFNKKTGKSRTLAKAKNPGNRTTPLVTPGQVNGDFAVFTRCGKNGFPCDVIRYRISTRQFVKVPRPRPFHYAPSVAKNGTIYFVGSGSGCGVNTAIYRRRNGNTTRIAKLGGKNEVSDHTFAIPRAGGGTDVFFSRVRCKNKSGISKRANPDIVRVKG